MELIPTQQSNLEPPSSGFDTPKATMLDLLLKLASKLILYFVKRNEQKEAEDENKLQLWKNVLVQGRNDRVSRVQLAVDAELLADKEAAKNSPTNPSPTTAKGKS